MGKETSKNWWPKKKITGPVGGPIWPDPRPFMKPVPPFAYPSVPSED